MSNFTIRPGQMSGSSIRQKNIASTQLSFSHHSEAVRWPPAIVSLNALLSVPEFQFFPYLPTWLTPKLGIRRTCAVVWESLLRSVYRERQSNPSARIRRSGQQMALTFSGDANSHDGAADVEPRFLSSPSQYSKRIRHVLHADRPLHRDLRPLGNRSQRSRWSNGETLWRKNRSRCWPGCCGTGTCCTQQSQ